MSRATLAGVPLLAANSVGWMFTQGVKPYQRTFECHKRDAEAILKASEGREVELVFTRRGRTKRVRALSVLSVAPAHHPDRMSVVVSDCRVWWSRELVVGDYNVRRRSGELRLVDGKLERIPPVADVTFARYSLKNEKTAWTPREYVEDVLQKVTQGRYAMDGADFAKAGEVDGIMLRDQGPQAVMRALGLVPGLSVWIDENGIARLTSESDGGEESELARSGPPVKGPALATKVDFARSRPSAIEVYFQCEDEVRFDFLDGITFTTDSREPRTLENVLPLPDTVTIDGVKVPKGTWRPINQKLLDAWNNDAANPRTVSVGSRTFTVPPLTFELIRRMFLAPGGYTAFFEIAQGGSKVWGLRVQAILQHYRQTYQIPRRWADRAYSMQPTRLAIVDRETGARAPADVYVDHAVIPSVRRTAFTKLDATLKLGANELAWPVGDSSRLLESGHVCAGSALTMLDPDAFVFKVHVKPVGAQLNDTVAVLPSALSDKINGDDVDIPSLDPRTARGFFLLQKGKLASKHRFTTVVTIATAPKGLGGLHKITVTPDRAKTFMPAAVAKHVRACRGPVMRIFIGSRVCTARSAWKDADARAIESAILDGKGRDRARLLDPDRLDDVAGAAAAAIYASFTDRWEGSHVTAFDPDRKPVGRIQSVQHKLSPDGVFVTELSMLPDLVPVDFMAYLPESTRRALFQKVQP